MKFINKFLLMVGFLSVTVISFADEVEDDFEIIADTDSIIVEATPKATTGINWNFELANQDKSQKIYVVLLQDGQSILPGLAPTQDKQGDAASFYVLNKGKAIRVAGLDFAKPITLIVAKENELEYLVDKKFDEPKEQIVYDLTKDATIKAAKSQGRIRYNFKVGRGNTAYMVFKDGKLKPVSKIFLIRESTESGLPLDRNIKE